MRTTFFQRVLATAFFIGMPLMAQVAGELDATFDAGTGPDAAVQAIALQGDGRILVGGRFAHWNGTPRPGLVRLNADGTLDVSFGPGLPGNGQVSAIAVAANGAIYVGGTFSDPSAKIGNGIVRLRADGTLDPSFNAQLPIGSSVNAVVTDAAAHVTIGGEFRLVGPVPRVAVARLHESGNVDESFGPLLAALASPFLAISPRVSTIAVASDGRLATGGDPIGGIINGVSYSGNPMWFSRQGTFDSAASPKGNDLVNAVAVQADGLLVAAFSLNSGKNDGDAVRRFLPNGAIDPGFSAVFRRNGIVDSHARCLLIDPEGRILAGGDFDRVNDLARSRLVRLFPDGTVDTRFAPNVGLNGTVSALARDDQGRVLIGGDFSQIQGIARTRIARLSNPPLPPRMKTPPKSATVSERGNVRIQVVMDPESSLSYQWYKNGVAMPGETTANLYLIDVRSPANYHVAVSNHSGTIFSDPVSIAVAPRYAGAVDTSFVPPGTGGLIPRADGRMYLTNQAKLSLLNLDGSVDSSFQLDTALGPSGTSIIMGGVALADGRLLLHVRRALSDTLERYRADGTWDSTFALRGSSAIHVASYSVRPDGSLILGGKFDPSSTTNPIRVLVRADPDGKFDDTFQAPTFAWPSEIRQMVALEDGSLIAMGQFYPGPLQVDYAVLRFLPDGSRDPNWHIGLSTTEQLLRDGSVFRISLESGAISKIRPDGTADPSFACLVQRVEDRGPGKVFLSAARPTLTQQSDGKILLTGDFGRVNGSAASNYARINADGTLDPSFIAPTFNLGTGAQLTEIRGMLFAMGSFQQINGVARPGLARLFRDGQGDTRIVNLSARARAADGANSLIVGFVLSGAGNSLTLVRGIGPSLTGFGVGGALAAVHLELFQGDRALGNNSAWSLAGEQTAALMQRMGAFALPAGSADAVIATELPPAAYTTKISPNQVDAGTALAEIYAAPTATQSSRLINLAARAELQPNNAAVSVGFTIAGTGEKQVLLRVVGPTLGTFGVIGASDNPRMKLMASDGQLAENDDWSSDGNAGFAAAAARVVGAFDLGPTSKDAAILRTLSAGNYTVLAESSDARAGIILVEIYEVSP